MQILPKTTNSHWRFFALLILLVSCGHAGAVSYSSAISDGTWAAEVSPFECRLTHAIPYYGNAVFRKGAGQDAPEFFLDVPAARLAEGEAQLRAEAPVWRPAVGSVEIGKVQVVNAAHPVQLAERETERILAELYQGREIVFSRDTWYDDDSEARVALTSIAFRRAYQTYLSCLAGLLPVNFEQIKRSAVYFEPGTTEELPENQLDTLEHILLYAQADRHLKEIYIDGHTDSVGTREENLQLSEERARLVTDYLVKRGMPEERIITRWHGERYPVKGNGTAANRAQNRRVTIRLERVEPVEIPSLAASAAGNGSSPAN